MKKVLSSLLLASTSVMMFGQVLVNENFENATIGNLGTDVTGATAGQNGWKTAYGANADYQIATIDAAHGKSLTINSYNSYSTAANTTLNTRLAFKETTVVASPTNNIVQGKFDLYTSPVAGTGTIQMRVLGMVGASSGVVGGFSYNVATRELRGLGTFINLATGAPTTYSIGFAAAPGVQLTANTWYTLRFTYNKNTGAIVWYWPGGSGGFQTDTATLGLIAGSEPEDVYLFNVTDTGNTVSKSGGFDNILVENTNAASLSTNELNDNNVSKLVSVYPNPTTDVLNINSDSKINKVSVYDMTGKKIDVKLDGDKVNVQALPAGAYLINIENKDGVSTEKFIKK